MSQPRHTCAWCGPSDRTVATVATANTRTTEGDDVKRSDGTTRNPMQLRATKHVLVTRLAILLLGCGVVLAACNGPGSANVAGESAGTTTSIAGAGATASGDALAFSQCMRSNGVPNFPDPGNDGVIPKESTEQLGVSVRRFQAGEHACQHLLPNGGTPPSQAAIERVAALGLHFAECMRAHGVALPDPGSDGRIPDPSSVGLNQGSPRFQSANRACGKYRPPYMPSNAAYNAYVRSQGS